MQREAFGIPDLVPVVIDIRAAPEQQRRTEQVMPLSADLARLISEGVRLLLTQYHIPYIDAKFATTRGDSMSDEVVTPRLCSMAKPWG
jgi:hypothetical protein